MGELNEGRHGVLTLEEEKYKKRVVYLLKSKAEELRQCGEIDMCEWWEELKLNIVKMMINYNKKKRLKLSIRESYLKEQLNIELANSQKSEDQHGEVINLESRAR